MPRTHWADWSIRQEGSTPIVIHQVVVVETLAESRRPAPPARFPIFLFYYSVQRTQNFLVRYERFMS